MQSVNENTIQLFTIPATIGKGLVQPTRTNTMSNKVGGVAMHGMTSSQPARAAAKFGAIPVQNRGASVAMSAGPQNF